MPDDRLPLPPPGATHSLSVSEPTQGDHEVADAASRHLGVSSGGSPLVAALAQLVRDRWDSECRSAAERHGSVTITVVRPKS